MFEQEFYNLWYLIQLHFLFQISVHSEAEHYSPLICPRVIARVIRRSRLTGKEREGESEATNLTTRREGGVKIVKGTECRERH
jgi:hypothetical protein